MKCGAASAPEMVSVSPVGCGTDARLRWRKLVCLVSTGLPRMAGLDWTLYMHDAGSCLRSMYS